MIKELKYIFYLLVIFFFIFFTGKYYFSDENKKNMFRTSNDLDSKIESFTENLVVLKSNTDEIIKYVENEDSKENKKYFFWKLLDKND